MSARYLDIINRQKVEVEKKSGDEIVADIVARAELEIV